MPETEEPRAAGPGRIDRDALDRAVFPTRHVVPTRFSDLDAEKRVGDVAFASLIEEGRSRFFREVAWYETRGRYRAVVASFQIEHVAELHYPQPVEIDTGILSLGRKTATMAQILRQDGRTAAYALTTIVVMLDGRPAAVPDEVRGMFEAVRLRGRTEAA